MSTTPRPSFEGSQLEGSGIPQLLPWAPMDPHQEVEDYGWRQPKYDPRMSDIEPDNLMLDHLSSSTKWGRMLSIGHGHVLMLARFADQRQTQVSDHWKPTKDGVGRPEMVPNPNGSQYLENYVVLESTFQDYRSWFQYIHYRHLVKLRRIHAHGRVMEFDTTRLEQFMYDLEIWYTYLNEDETARVQQKPGYLPAGAPSSNCVYLLRPGCEWIQDLSNSIGEGFAAIWAAHIWADLHGKEVAPHLEMAFETLPMVTRVLLYCFDRQHAFEHGLSHSHADDILLHKRINILSNADMATIGPQNAENAVATFFDPLKARIMDYQTKMLTQYHYRLLRDWGYGRPWEKLMLIVDPGDFPRSSPEEVDTGVKQLQQFITQSPKFVSQLFDVLPLLPSNIEDDPGDCLTCTTATVQPGRLFARLRCGHLYHVSCLLRYWDASERYLQDCMLCRATHPRLRERVNFETFSGIPRPRAFRQDADCNDQNYFAKYGRMELEMEDAARNGVPFHLLPRAHQHLWQNRNIFKWQERRRDIHEAHCDCVQLMDFGYSGARKVSEE